MGKKYNKIDEEKQIRRKEEKNRRERKKREREMYNVKATLEHSFIIHSCHYDVWIKYVL